MVVSPDPFAVDTIDTANHFVKQAELSLIDFKFSDFHELLDSFFLECLEFERRGIESDESYWEQNAQQFSDLWFLYAYAEYLREKGIILTGKLLNLPKRDLNEISYLITMFHENAMDFQRFIPDVDRSYSTESLLDAHDAYMTDLAFWQELETKEGHNGA